jgi:Nucleoside-diphosphate-sugar epimerases
VNRAVVTGSKGFVGRHVSAELLRRGWDVEGWDLVDGRDAHRLFTVMDPTYDLIVHCAATAPHRAAIDGQAMNLAHDLHLDAAMFEWAVKTNTRVLYLSSSAAYPVNLQRRHIRRLLRESDIDLTDCSEPDSNYGWAKLTGERMARAAGQHVPVHVVRPASGYGEDQDERFPFGAFVARAKRREHPFVIWGDGTQVRDWIHIDDVVGAMLAVVDNDVREPVNISTGVGASMLDLVGLITTAVGYAPEVELRLDKPVGVHHRVLDASKLNRWYTPKISLTEGVERAVRA